jgi:hypothetical protein
MLAVDPNGGYSASLNLSSATVLYECHRSYVAARYRRWKAQSIVEWANLSTSLTCERFQKPDLTPSSVLIDAEIVQQLCFLLSLPRLRFGRGLTESRPE